MLRIAIAIGFCGLIAACGEQAQPAGPGAPSAPLDYIDAVPITEDAAPPVATPPAPAKKEEPEEEEAEAEAEKAETVTVPASTATPAPAPAAAPRPAPPANDAAAATRQANEAVAPRSETERPYSPN